MRPRSFTTLQTSNTLTRMRRPLLSWKEGNANRLAFLLVCLACWAINRISTYYEAILLRLEDGPSNEDDLLVPSYPSSITRLSTIEHANEHSLRHPNFTFDFPLCLIHVGKAAGSSLSCGLGLTYADCEGMPRDPPLPNTYYFHMKKDTCRPVENAHAKNSSNVPIATFLILIRNPLTRIQSWFHFEKNIIPIRQNKET
jgi:hypothetical protein